MSERIQGETFLYHIYSSSSFRKNRKMGKWKYRILQYNRLETISLYYIDEKFLQISKFGGKVLDSGSSQTSRGVLKVMGRGLHNGINNNNTSSD